MKKKIVALLTGIMAASLLLSGCQSSKGIDNDDVKISQYKGVEIDEVDKADDVTDKDVTSFIDSVRESNATSKTIKNRTVKKGDTVYIDFEGKMNGKKLDNGSAKNQSLKIGSNSFIPGFEDSIIGHKTGDKFVWNGKFPKNYSEELAGKKVSFTIKVRKITLSTTPELNDAFVKKVSSKSKTVAEYKKEVKKKLEKEAQDTYTESVESGAWEKVLSNTKVKKYDKTKQKNMEDSWISQYKQYAKAYNMEYSKFLEQQMGMTEEEFNKQVKAAVKDTMKQTMVTNAIADKENIKMSKKDYNKELKAIANSYGYGTDVDRLKKAFSEDDLKDAALKNMVKEWLGEHCVQVAKKSSDSKSSSDSSSSSSSSDSSSSSN